MTKGKTKGNVNVYMVFLNVWQEETERTLIATFRNINWAVGFIESHKDLNDDYAKLIVEEV